MEGKGKRVEEKEVEKKGKREKVVLGNVLFVFVHNQTVWISASESAGSVPSTQSRKREVGTVALWPHARAC